MNDQSDQTVAPSAAKLHPAALAVIGVSLGILVLGVVAVLLGPRGGGFIGTGYR